MMNNDLISREALITTILKDGKLDGVNANWEVNRILVHIDNAPTVEIPVARWDAYCEGQKVGYEKAIEERPQGEWVYDSDLSITIDIYKCSLCGCFGHTHFKFCPNCGACMQKGGAE